MPEIRCPRASSGLGSPAAVAEGGRSPKRSSVLASVTILTLAGRSSNRFVHGAARTRLCVASARGGPPSRSFGAARCGGPGGKLRLGGRLRTVKKVLLICSHLQQFSKIISPPTGPFPRPDNVNGMRNHLPINHFPPTLFSPKCSPIYERAIVFMRRMKNLPQGRGRRRRGASPVASDKALGHRGPRYERL